MFKKLIFLLFALFILLSGCSTFNQNSKSPISNDRITGGAIAWWLVVRFDDNKKPIENWVIKDTLFFYESNGSIGFRESNKDFILLFRNYTFTLIRLNDWVHPGFKLESVIPSEPDDSGIPDDVKELRDLIEKNIKKEKEEKEEKEEKALKNMV